jgi:hypothetical protein
MFCQYCGTRLTEENQKVCQECGRQTGQTPEGPRWSAPRWSAAPQGAWCSGQPVMWVHAPRVIVRHSLFRPLLLLVGALILFPLAIPLLFGSLVLGAALFGLALHLLPVLAIGAIIYWALTNRRRAW